MKLVRPDPDPVRDKFAQARKELSAALIEREDEIDLVLTALVANEHVLLVGPPGCGKSLLLDSVLAWTGGTKFSILLTKFTSVEEVMGPVSLAALKADKYVRVAATARTISALMPIKKILLVGTGVGVAVGVISYACPHELSALVSGVCGACTAVAVQVGRWVRRSTALLGFGGTG